MKICVFAAGLFLIASCAFAGDFDGKWKGEYAGGMGDPMTLTYTFKTAEKTCTGSVMSSTDSKETPLKDCKIDAKNISFAADVDFQGMTLKFKYKGVLSGEEIKLTFDMDMGGMPGMGGPGAGGPGAGAPPAGGAPAGGPPAAKQELTVKKVKA
jgi:hypothetical protein